jgi:hypothetical protein
MRELLCPETAHTIFLDEATGRILGFNFGSDEGRQRVADAIQQILNDSSAAESILATAPLRGVEPTIVVATLKGLIDDRHWRWRIEGDRLIPMRSV